MATIQPKTSRGHKYWYIVESRRVNGKPRPIVLAYLGKAADLLKRLQGMAGAMKVKSYSHGAVAAGASHEFARWFANFRRLLAVAPNRRPIPH